jgi:hypothetical protein
MLPSNESLIKRRTAYACCLGKLLTKRHKAEERGRDAEVIAINKQMAMVSLGLHVMRAYAIGDEECRAQWAPTDEDVCCVMHMVDPCCVKCGCVEPVGPVPFDCTITPSWTAIAVDASFQASAVAGVQYLIATDTVPSGNLWASHLNQTVIDGVFAVQAEGSVGLDPITTTLWTIGGGVAGHLYPAIDLVDMGAGTYILTSQYPNVNGNRTWNVQVQGSADGTTWVPLYTGPEAALADPLWVYNLPDFVEVRVLYRFGLCDYGPFPGVGALGPFFFMVSNRAANVGGDANLTVSVIASTGDFHYRLWDGTQGGGTTSLNVPFPVTGPFSGTAQKPFYGWPVLNPGDILPSGQFASISSSGEGLIVCDLSGLAAVTVVNITGNPGLPAVTFNPAAAPVTVILNDNGLTGTLIIPGAALTSVQANNNQLVGLPLNAFPNLTSVIAVNNQFATQDTSANAQLVTINFRGNDLTTFNPAANTLCTFLNLAFNAINAAVPLTGLSVLQTLLLDDNLLPGQVTSAPGSALQTFTIQNNQLAPGSLNVTPNTGLLTLYTSNNPNLGDITGLALCVLLQDLRCANCGITTIPATLTALQKLYAGDNAGLAVVGLPTYTALVECDLNDCALTVADPTACPNLQYLNLSGNIIAAGVVNTTLNAALRSVGLVGCGLNSHDPTGNALLEELYLGTNPGITVMPNLANNLVLRIYESPGCPVTTFAIASTVVRQINILGAACPTINVSGKSLLTRLQVGSNAVCTTLDFSNCAVNDITMNAMPSLLSVNGSNNALPLAMVNHVVSSLPLSAPPGSTCRLEGGTNAVPSPALVAAKPNWIITTN